MKRRTMPLVALGIALFSWHVPANAQDIGKALGGDPNTIIYAPITVASRKLFDVAGNAPLSAAERADRINRRLESLIARKGEVPPFTAKDLIHQDQDTLITLGGETMLTVTEDDAQQALSTRDELALQWGAKLSEAVADARAAQQNPLKGVGILIRNTSADLVLSALKWLPRLVGALVLWILFVLLARLMRWASKWATERTIMDSNVRQLIRAMFFYGTWILGTIAILATLGLDSASIATGLGISGFVLGFAFKDILSHFFAGLMLLMGRQFHIGDQIVVKEFEGTVERIELRALFLRTYDNRLVIIPNGDVFTSTVTSNTASPFRRRDILIGIGYKDDIRKAQKLAIETVSGVPGVSEEPAPDVLVDELAASTVNLRIRFYTNSHRSDYLKVGSECMRLVKDAFAAAGISMPTDTQTVFIENLARLQRSQPGPTEKPKQRNVDVLADD